MSKSKKKKFSINIYKKWKVAESQKNKSFSFGDFLETFLFHAYW